MIHLSRFENEKINLYHKENCKSLKLKKNRSAFELFRLKGLLYRREGNC